VEADQAAVVEEEDAPAAVDAQVAAAAMTIKVTRASLENRAGSSLEFCCSIEIAAKTELSLRRFLWPVEVAQVSINV
jgi:hypothetical protein